MSLSRHTSVIASGPGVGLVGRSRSSRTCACQWAATTRLPTTQSRTHHPQRVIPTGGRSGNSLWTMREFTGCPPVAARRLWGCRRRRRGPKVRQKAGRSIPPRGCPKVYRRRFGSLGCHSVIHLNILALLDSPSPAEMEPEVGFEPTTFRLRVEEPSSSRYCPGRFWLLTSAGSSAECAPDLPCYGWRNDQGNDQPGHGRTAGRALPSDLVSEGEGDRPCAQALNCLHERSG
jgi:hypothetical protein